MANRYFGVAALLFVVALVPAIQVYADAIVIHVDASQVAGSITPWMYGSCIEDVNHEIYGGLYDQKIFGESFEEPPPAVKFADWTSYGGGWMPDGVGCRVDADSGGMLVRNTPEFADGTVETDIKLPDDHGNNAGLLVRVGTPGVGADNFNGYEVSLSASGQQIILGKHHHDFHMLQTVSTAITSGTWHHLRVDLKGPRISVFLDGSTAPQIDFTDTQNPLLTGKIALRTWNADADFRKVRIQVKQRSISTTFRATAVHDVSGQWDPIRTGRTTAVFLRDNTLPYNGAYCQKITHGPGPGRVGIANQGLNHWGIAVRKGQTFQGRVYLRTKSLNERVTVALQSADGRTNYATQAIRGLGVNWAKYPFKLTANTTDKGARFALWIEQPGTVWVDQAVLMGTGAEQFHGLPIRADIANALVAEGVTFLRYGGSMVNAPGYRWKNMIGNPDRRPPYAGTWYPYSTNGFGIFDFLNFCDSAHIGDAFAINIEETAQDAADLADYLTAPATNLWGHRRAVDGHPAPYHVHYIEIGNEECQVDDAADYAHYIEQFHAIAHAIHSRNAALQFVCAALWRPDSPNVESVFKALDGEAAAWDLHVGSDDPSAGTDVDRQLTQMEQRFRQWDPQTKMKAVIFEENGGLHSMQRALGHATTVNATRRHGDFVLVDCAANCLQPWGENDNGWDQGQVFFTPDRTWAMPPAYAQKIVSLNAQPIRIQTLVTGVEQPDVLATRSADGKTLVLNVVNVSGDAQRATIILSGFEGVRSVGQVWTLAAALAAVNPPDGPEVVRPKVREFRIAGTQFDYTFSAHSDTVFRLRR